MYRKNLSKIKTKIKKSQIWAVYFDSQGKVGKYLPMQKYLSTQK